MIFFDLDGVFISDFHYTMYKDKEFYAKTLMESYPLFQPPFSYGILTSRHVSLKSITYKWIDLRLQNKPFMIFHDNPTLTSSETQYKEPLYKLEVLNEKNIITAFIESSVSQVEFLKNNVKNKKIKIILFRDFIANSLSFLNDLIK